MHAVRRSGAALALVLASCARPPSPVAPPPVTTITTTTTTTTVATPPAAAEPPFGAWEKASFGTYMVPSGRFHTEQGQYDLLVHFHAGQMATEDYRQAAPRAVIVSLAYGAGSKSYDEAFKEPERFAAIVQELSAKLAERAGVRKLAPKRIALVAWSAGYASVGRILEQGNFKDVVDTVVLLDGLHTNYFKPPKKGAPQKAAKKKPETITVRTPTGPKVLESERFGPFVKFAKLAAKGEKLMVVTHSSIQPPGYASTTECMGVLIDAVGAERSEIEEPNNRVELVRYVRADLADFHAFGYRGETKHDHIQQLHLVRDVLREFLTPRWTPPNYRGPKPRGERGSSDSSGPSFDSSGGSGGDEGGGGAGDEGGGGGDEGGGGGESGE